MAVDIVYTCVALGFLTALSYFLPPLLDGVERKIKARIHSRIGPPIMQTWYDLMKLFEKTTYLPQGAYHLVLLIALYFVLTISAIGVLLSISLINVFTALIIALILFMIGQVVFVAIPFMSSNPFAIVGGSREVMLMLVNETFTVLVFGILLWYTKGFTSIGPAYGIAVLLLLIAAYVSCARPPFDLAEAEPELASGVIIELSGPLLGLLHYSNLARRFFIKLFVIIICLIPLVGYAASSVVHITVNGVILAILLTCILWCIYAALSALLGRSRIDAAPVFLLKIYIPLIIIFFVIAYVMW
ncbi:NADH-quinone oxidoreductase subunit H [Desulfurococcaceae archaeon MEX13E-LK6-19]|nr:NADH-quinone oxidoreductase subunit H [Desulfurococcaceae archaeon MEX13E-LK6-19]